MQFTLSDVRHGSLIYLQGEKDKYIKESLEIDDDYVWDDQHWCNIDCFSIRLTNKNLYTVIYWRGQEGYCKAHAHNMPAEEVVTYINEMCNGVLIETIRIRDTDAVLEYK
jgi:hypothetical protein